MTLRQDHATPLGRGRQLCQFHPNPTYQLEVVTWT